MTQFLDEGRAPVVLDTAFLALNPIPVIVSGISIALEPGDIQIGAVEIKDATTTNRAVVSAAGELSVNTELPAAAALTDTLLNPTTSLIGAATLALNPFTGVWERIRAVDASADFSINTGDPSLLTYAVLTGADGPTQARKIEADIPVDALNLATQYGLNVNSLLMGYNGATHDRLRSSIANGLEVDVTRIQSTVSVTISGFAGLTDAELRASAVPVDTELPAAALLAEGTSNPTVPGVAAFGMFFNETDGDWDRLTGAELQSDLVTSFDQAAQVTYSLMAGINGSIMRRVQAPSDFDGDNWSQYFKLAVGASMMAISPGSSVTYDRLRSDGNDADALVTLALGGLNVNSFLRGYNGSTWDRLRSSIANGLEVDVTQVQGTVATTVSGLLTAETGSTDSDAIAALAGDVLLTQAHMVGFNGTTYDRLRADGNDADGVAPVTLGLLNNNSFLMGYDTIADDWNRVTVVPTELDRTIMTGEHALLTYSFIAGIDRSSNVARRIEAEIPVDAFDTATQFGLNVNSILMGYNGSTHDRLRSSIAQGLEVDVTRIQGTVAVDIGTLDAAEDSVEIGVDATVLRAAIAASGIGSNTVVAAVTGERIKVLSLMLRGHGPVIAAFESAGGTVLTGGLPLDPASDAGFELAPPASKDMHHFETLAGEALVLDLDDSIEVGGYIVYYTEA